MKQSALIFSTGLALGIAGTIALRPANQPPDSKGSSTQEKGGEHSASYLGSEGRTAKRGERSGTKRKPRHQGSRLSSGDARTDLADLLALFSGFEDETDMDMMALLRKASLLTMISEGEAVDLLNMLYEVGADEQSDMDSEFIEIASVIVFTRLCELNGPEAMRMVSEGILKDAWDGQQEDFLAMGMNSWVAADPEGAQQWFEGIVVDLDEMASQAEDAEELELEGMAQLLEEDAFRMAYFNGMAKHDPEGLEERIAGLSHEEVRGELQAEVMNSLVRTEEDPAGLQAILEKSVDHHETRLEAIKKLSEKDTQAAADWVESQPPGNTRDQEITQVGTVMMEQQGDEGIEWYMAQEMQAPDQAADRLSRITNQLLKGDYQKAESWVEGQPDNATRDSAEVTLAWNAHARGDWEQSMNWIVGVEAEDRQQTTLNQMLRRSWNQNEQALPPEFIEAAEAAGFGETAKNYKGR